MLACLQWLGDFQILLFIPPEGSVPVKNIAELAGVDTYQLRRVIRLTTTRGILTEPSAGLVAHTPLSARFIEDPSLLDAVTFLSGTVAPSALQMSTATQRFGPSASAATGQGPGGETAFGLAFNTSKPFETMRKESPKLNRQWSALLAHGSGVPDAKEVAFTLSQLNWTSLSNPCVVEVSHKS